MQKNLNITYATVSPGRLFSLCYQHQVGYFSLIGLLWWMNHEIQLKRPPSPKQNFFGMVSILWCHLCSTVLYSGRCTNSKQENIIIFMLSSNRCVLWVILFYINWHKHSEHLNIFVVMLMGFKSKTPWTHSVGNLLLTEPWNYFIRSVRADRKSAYTTYRHT